MSGRPRPLGTVAQPDEDNMTDGWAGYQASRNRVRAPGPRYRSWGTGTTTAEARRVRALAIASARMLRHLPGRRLRRGEWAMSVPGVEPDNVRGWRFYAGLALMPNEHTTWPLAVLLRVMWGEKF